jgi:hypothetical protein
VGRPRIPDVNVPSGASADLIRRLANKEPTGDQVAAKHATVDVALPRMQEARGDRTARAIAMDRSAEEVAGANNELLFQRGLAENAANPDKAAKLQGLNQSFIQAPWVHAPDFADSFDGEPSQGYRGVMMSRFTPQEAMKMAYGDRGLRVLDRLIDRNAANQDAPFPIIRSGGNHLTQPIFAFQNMADEFPEPGGAIGMYRPGLRYATWNSQYAPTKVPLHEVLGHGLMDGGNSARLSQQDKVLSNGTHAPQEWEADIEGVIGRAQRRMDRVNEQFLRPSQFLPDGTAWHPDATDHETVVKRMVGDPSELRAIGFTLKHDAADVFGVDPVSRADNDSLLNLLLDKGYRKYDVPQPKFKQGPRQGQEADFFNEEQRGLKTYFESLDPGDQEIFRDLWFKFGNKGEANGQLVV